MTHEIDRLAEIPQEPGEITALRPGPHYLMLLLRAAIADDGKGGPWLAVVRNVTTGGATLYTHRITLKPVTWFTSSTMIMMSGDDALAFTVRDKWADGDLLDPTTAQLRALGDYAIRMERGDEWNADYRRWVRMFHAPETRELRAAMVREHREAARALRWHMAKQWAALPAE